MLFYMQKNNTSITKRFHFFKKINTKTSKIKKRNKQLIICIIKFYTIKNYMIEIFYQ